jgi:hypothetical protein
MAIGMAPWQLAESEFPLPGDEAPAEKQAPIPPEETALYKAGESLQRGAEKMFPVNPLRAEDFLTQVGSGIGSLPTSFIPYLGPVIYAGSTAEEAVETAPRQADCRKRRSFNKKFSSDSTHRWVMQPSDS